MTSLKAARIIEVGTPEQYAILIRTKRGDPFTRIGRVEQGEVEVDLTHRKFYEDKLSIGLNIEVLAEFPVTLADLIPEGCTRFECLNNAGTQKHYVSRANHAWWKVTDDPMQEIWRLEDVAEQFDLDVRTVVPLQVHLNWVEAQR